MTKLNKIEKVLDDNGFDISYGNDWVEIHQYTPAGEDWFITLRNLEEIKEYAEDYCPDDDFEMWVEAKYHGKDKSIPSIPELWQDQLWKRDILQKVANEIQSGD